MSQQQNIVQTYNKLEELYEELLDSVSAPKATIVSAVPLTSEKRKTLEQLVLRVRDDVEFTFVVDPTILGGLCIRMGDWMYDASLSSQLRHMTDRLKE